MNILSAIRDQLSPEILGQVSRSIGESPEATKNALGFAMPALLASAASKAASPDGASGLFNLLKEHSPQGGWASTAGKMLSGVTGGGGVGGGIGAILLNFLLGPKMGALRDFIASKAGIRGESATNLLSTGGNMLMGTLGRQVASQGLGAAGLGEMLRSQLPHLQGLLPPELTSMLGLGSLFGAGKAAATAPTPSYPTTPATEHAYTAPLTTTSPGAISSGTRILRWAWLPALLILGALFMMNRYNRNKEEVGAALDTAYTNTSSEVNRTIGTTVSNIQMPRVDTTSMTAFNDKLKSAITSADGTPIDLSGVNFDSSGNLSSTAKSSLGVLGRTLTENSSLKLNITTYGKTTDEAAARANTIKTWLTGSAGISTDRISVDPEVGDSTVPRVSFMK